MCVGQQMQKLADTKYCVKLETEGSTFSLGKRSRNTLQEHYI